MALAILDGTQTATTLSTILSSGQHITAHTVVSLGTQAITDMRGAVSGSVVSISNFPSSQVISGTVTANPTGTQTIAGTVTANLGLLGGFRGAVELVNYNDEDSQYYQVAVPNAGGPYIPTRIVGGTVTVGNTVTIEGTVTIGSALPAGTNRIGVVTIGAGTVTIGAGTAQIGSVTASISNSVTIGSLPAISGTVTALGVSNLPLNMAGSGLGFDNSSRLGVSIINGSGTEYDNGTPFPVYFTNSLPAGQARIGVVTIGGGTVTVGAGTAQIGSVTASISGTVPISISSVTVGNSLTIGSLPAITGTVTANIAISSTAITSGSFTSLTSATLVPANTARKMATVYNLGAGQLFVNAGSSATTLGGGFMVALSSGDYFECDYTTTTLSAIFATAGTASWVSH